MDYSKHYDLLIKRAQNRTLNTQYHETHHIIPKCLGGNDKPSNLVILTAREHFIAHLLLCEIYPDNDKLAYALWAICNLENPYQTRYTPSSRVIEQIRINISKAKKQSRWINNGVEDKKVPLSSTLNYIEKGWVNVRITSSTKSRVVVNDGTKDSYITLSEYDSYIRRGYFAGTMRTGQVLGSNLKTKGRVCVNNGIETKRVEVGVLNEYLSAGWLRGYHYQIDYSKRKPGGRRKIKS